VKDAVEAYEKLRVEQQAETIARQEREQGRLNPETLAALEAQVANTQRAQAAFYRANRAFLTAVARHGGANAGP
jgi:hypothetical protein